MARDKIRLGVIGCGAIFRRRHLPGLTMLKQAGLDNFEVTACCDTVEANAQEVVAYVEANYGNRPVAYGDWEDLVRRAPVDAVSVCLPHGLHHIVGIAGLEAGLHVLMEKPFTVTVKTGRALVDAAARTGRILAVAVPFRRTPSQRAVRWAINDAGLIGTPRVFFANRAQMMGYARATPAANPNVWRKNRMMGGGVFVIDSGFHFQDTARYLFGEPEKVYAEVRAYRDDGPPATGRHLIDYGENTVFVTYTFANGVIGTFCWCGVAEGRQTHQCTIHGSEGMIEDLGYGDILSIFHLYASGLEVRRRDGTVLGTDDLRAAHWQAIGPDAVQRLFPNGVTDHYAIEQWDFFDSIENDRRPEIDGEDALRTLALVESIYESAWSGQAVRVADVLAGTGPYGWQADLDTYWDAHPPPRLTRE